MVVGMKLRERTDTRITARFASPWVLAASLLVVVIAGPSRAQQPGGARIALDGYCPVCIVEARKWEKGSADHQATFDGQTYRFPNDAINKIFVANPTKYVPALGGDCVVCYQKLGKRVPGSTAHAARYENRLYLFPGDEQRQAFLKDSAAFVNADLAIKGDCAVCLDRHSKRVAGKAEFPEIFHGLRYLFPSAAIQAEFRKDPARYAGVAAKADGKAAQRSEGAAAIVVAPPAGAQQPAGARIALDGYCPVCVVDARKWEKGSADYKALYDGQTYYFPNEAIKQKFVANPAKYVPALDGDCIVCFAKLGKRVPGTTQYVVRYENRIFLFPSAKEQEVFAKEPEAFGNADLALKGDCAVCLDHHSKRVPGKAEFSEVHRGLRYLFPSAAIQGEFRKDPARYAAAAAKADGKSAKANDGPAGKELLTVTGKTACAGCEYGVTPLQSPDELGLAVNLPDGKVIVVEQAHKLYANVYENRFAGQQVRVSGHVLKQEGRFTWIEPTALTVVK